VAPNKNSTILNVWNPFTIPIVIVKTAKARFNDHGLNEMSGYFQ